MFLLLTRFRMCAALAATSVVLLAACGGDPKDTATPTPRPIPAAVNYRPEPQGVELGDPKFDALPGTKADYGRLGGTVYRIEIPDNWNGRLVLYMHGFQGLDTTARVETPGIREYLIRNGIAWGASSFSSTALIPGRAADETAALWDLFVSKYGEPKRTYVMGHSMGGGATHIAAERYGNRYDGALGMCGFAGQTAQSEIVDDFFFAGAYAAGVTQAQFDASSDIPNLIATRIVPALDNPAARKTFEDILLGITGGSRPFDRLGIHLEEQTNWSRSGILVPFHIVGNSDRTYRVRPGGSVSSDDFNRGGVRFKADPERAKAFIDGNEVTGDLQMPMITLHTTGDWQVPIDQEQILRRKVDAAGKGDQLVQRIVQDAGHCHFTESEWERSFEDLVNWVEKGIKPDGDNVLVDDLTHAGERFTIAPRLGTDAADDVPGAAERVTVRGTVTIDGGLAGPDTFFWMDVSKDGLRQACSFSGDPIVAGHYQLTVAGEGELHGCGAPGTKLRLVVFVGDKQLVSQPLDWPTGRETTLDAALETAAATDATAFTAVYGGVLGADGKRMPPGTRVEAYAGETLCAAASIPPVVMPFSDPDSYLLLVPGPAAITACTTGASLAFRVDGKAVAQTSTNDLDQNGHALDLVASAGG
jgi:pimeloyl-ACP methyl ester carboxylesterase